MVGASFKISGEHIAYLRARAQFQSTPEHKCTVGEILRAVITLDKMAFDMTLKELAKGFPDAEKIAEQLPLAISSDYQSRKENSNDIRQNQQNTSHGLIQSGEDISLDWAKS